MVSKGGLNKHEGSSSRYTTTVDPCGSRLLALRGRADGAGPDKGTAPAVVQPVGSDRSRQAIGGHRRP
jgi:hypothetical protein